MTTTLQLSLLDNGIDFVVRGVSAVYAPGSTDDARFKYGLLHVFSGTLLVLKERLRREHKSLVWKRVSDVDSASSKTVDFDEALLRLKKVCGIELSDDDNDLLRWCQRKRNQLEHYECELNAREAQKHLGDLVGFVHGFLADHLDVDLQHHVGAQIWQELQDLQKIAERIEAEELEAWRQRAARYYNLSDDELESLAEVEPFHPRHNPDPAELTYCSECGGMTLASAEPDISVCTNLDCRQVERLTECERCGVFTDGTFCDDCTGALERYMERD